MKGFFSIFIFFLSFNCFSQNQVLQVINYDKKSEAQFYYDTRDQTESTFIADYPLNTIYEEKPVLENYEIHTGKKNKTELITVYIGFKTKELKESARITYEDIPETNLMFKMNLDSCKHKGNIYTLKFSIYKIITTLRTTDDRNKEIFEKIRKESEEAKRKENSEKAKKLRERIPFSITELTEQGNKFEQQKKYVNALSSYYDALVKAEYEPDEDFTEADEKFRNISRLISSGMPGFYVSDDFDRHDYWIALLTEAEQYFTRNPLFSLEACDELKLKKTDYDSRTYTFSLPVKKTFRNKNCVLMSIITQGVAAYYKDGSNIYYWPDKSINKTVTEENDFTKQVNDVCYNGYFNTMSFVYHGIISETEDSGETSRFKLSFMDFDSYDFNLDLVDTNGKLLIKGPEKTTYSSGSTDNYIEYSIPGVTSEIKKLIDSHEAIVVLSGFYLRYGRINTNHYSETNREWLENLSALEIDLNKVFFTDYEGKTTPDNVQLPCCADMNTIYHSSGN